MEMRVQNAFDLSAKTMQNLRAQFFPIYCRKF